MHLSLLILPIRKDIVDHLYNIKKYIYLLEHVVDKSDRVAVNEIQKLREYEEALLNKTINDNLFSYKNCVIWVFGGKEQKVNSHRDFNQLLSKVCNEVYSKTPVMVNELFNRHKLSGMITQARKSYLTYLAKHYSEDRMGFPEDKFPPEKTIYFSLLLNTGLHQNGGFADSPTNKGFMPLWEACEEFLQSTENKARKVSELIKILSAQPYKLKYGFLEFWIPTYLFIKRQDLHSMMHQRSFYTKCEHGVFRFATKAFRVTLRLKGLTIDGVKLGFLISIGASLILGKSFL